MMHCWSCSFITLLPLLSLCHIPVHAGLSQCVLNGSTAFDRYEASNAAHRYAVDKPFPSTTDAGNGSEFNDYLRAVAIPPLVLIVFGLCICCGLCIFTCCNMKTLDNSVEGCCHPPKCYANKDGVWRKCAWIFLISMVFCGFAFLVVAYTQEEKETDAISGLPSILGSYANFIDNDIEFSINCIVTSVRYVTANATALSQNMGNTPEQQQALEAIRQASEEINQKLNDSDDSLTKVFQDMADKFRDLESDAQNDANKAASINKDIVISILSVVMLCGLCSLAITVATGRSEQVSRHGKVLGCISCGTILFLLLLFLIAAIYDFVVIFFAGFCVDPFNALAQLQTDTDDKSGYYIQCPTYSDAELRSKWPWQTEQDDAKRNFEQLETSLTTLQQSGLNGVAPLSSSIYGLGNTLYADDGVLGYEGFFSCQLLERLLQGIIIQVCSKWYNPTVLIMECLVCLGLIVIAIEITQRCLKRIDSDHGSYSTHENKVVADPSIVGDEDL
eukprot:m.173632 g.173632  ORF g.173632 m.173632 type:complete len:503 (+) comp18306_c0_seq1:95-1603(+)